MPPPLRFAFRPLPQPPDDLTESEVRICSSQFAELTGSHASVNRLKPWKGRIVAVKTEAGTVYRIVRGHGCLPIPKGSCWLGPRTRSQLDVHPGAALELKAVSNAWWGRILYYHNHLDDAVRFSFRIGFWGFVFALLSLVLTVVSIVKS